MATPDFDERVVQEAENITDSPRGMGADAAGAEGHVSNPVAVAGLADTVKNAIAGMHRAKATADALAANSSRLVGNISTVDSLNAQLQDANQQLEAAIAATDGPLENTAPAGADTATQAPSPAAASSQGAASSAPANHTSLDGQVKAAAQAAGNQSAA